MKFHQRKLKKISSSLLLKKMVSENPGKIKNKFPLRKKEQGMDQEKKMRDQ